MSNVQLYLTIGIPTFAVILALLISLFQNSRLSDRVDRISERIVRQFEKLSDKIDRMAEQHHKDVLMLMTEIVSHSGRLTSLVG